MSTLSSGFDQFRNSLHKAAANSLERTHPHYVTTFRNALKKTGGLDKALLAVLALGELNRVCEELNRHIDWGSLQKLDAPS